MRDLHDELTALTRRLARDARPRGGRHGAARAAAPRRRGAARAGGPRSPTALAALAAAFALTMAASPDARSAVLEWLGLKSVKIERREPTAPPPQPGTLGSGLGLGTPVTLAQARERSPFLRLPAADGLGAPDAIYVGDGSVSLVYGERAATRARRRPALRARPGVPRARRAVHREDDRRGDASSSGCRVDGDPRTSSPARTGSPTRATAGRPLRGPAARRQHAARRARRRAADPRRGGHRARPRVAIARSIRLILRCQAESRVGGGATSPPCRRWNARAQRGTLLRGRRAARVRGRRRGRTRGGRAKRSQWRLASPDGRLAARSASAARTRRSARPSAAPARACSPRAIGLRHGGRCLPMGFPLRRRGARDALRALQHPRGQAPRSTATSRAGWSSLPAGRTRARVELHASDDGFAYRTTLDGPARTRSPPSAAAFTAPSGARVWLQRFHRATRSRTRRARCGTRRRARSASRR